MRDYMVWRYILTTLSAAYLVIAGTAPVHAHSQNQSYIFFNIDPSGSSGRFEMTLPDIDRLVDVDADGDGTVTEEEFLAQPEPVFDYFAERFSIEDAGQTLDIDFRDAGILETPQGTFGQLTFQIVGLDPLPENVTLQYDVPGDLGGGHTGYAVIESNSRTGVENNESFISVVFNTGEKHEMSLLPPNRWAVFGDFVVEGIWHIWLGFDHLLFLVVLVLPAVMAPSGTTWVPVDNFRVSFVKVLKIVTAFTVSHSITLTLATLGYLRLPSSIVETVIALSIVAVAFGNLFPRQVPHGLLVVFVFGLVHGFGFANVLAPLGIDPAATGVSLLGFNIGVEIGQVAVVLAILPLLFLIRNWRLYPSAVLRGASVACILVASIWAVERGMVVLSLAGARLFGA